MSGSVRAIVIALLSAAVVAACAPGGDNDDSGDAAPTGVQTDASQLGDVTLVVWDQEVRGGQNAQIERLNAAFMEKYPNITIERVARSFEDLQTTLRLALSGDDAPDVSQVNNGRADMGQFVEADLIRALDPWAEAYGWTQRYPEAVRALASYSADGVTFGSGELYGLAQMGEVVGVFVNLEKLATLGIELPTTWADFEAALATAKQAGEIPLQFGNLEQWPGIHVFGAIQSRYVDPDTVRDLGFGVEGGDWTSDDNMQAAEKLVEFVDKGYFTEGFNGVAYDDAAAAFGRGEGVFLIGGTWLTADLQEALGTRVGFILPPGDGSDYVATGGTSLPFAVSTASEAPDAGAAYIDFITSPDAMRIITREGGLPIVDTATQTVPDGVQRQVFVAWDTVATGDGLVPYLDYATPTFSDTLTAAIQDLTAKQVTPQQFLQRLQDDYSAFVSGGG